MADLDRDALISRVTEAMAAGMNRHGPIASSSTATEILNLLKAEGRLSPLMEGSIPAHQYWHRRASLTALERHAAEAEVERLRGILGSLSLYVDWRWMTSQLTTDQKEAWAEAVEAWQRDLHKDDPRALAELRPADRWWLCPTCGVSISSGLNDGPHEGCMWAEEKVRRG